MVAAELIGDRVGDNTFAFAVGMDDGLAVLLGYGSNIAVAACNNMLTADVYPVGVEIGCNVNCLVLSYND